MERKELTPDLLQQLKEEGYRALIAKGSPEQTNEGYVQVLMASRQEPHNEETAEAAWQTSTDDDAFLREGRTKFYVELPR